jgi:hypothetical protein
MSKKPLIRVQLLNLNSLGTAAGWGEGKTLADAQSDALRKARSMDPDATLSDSGWQVLFRDRVIC